MFSHRGPIPPLIPSQERIFELSCKVLYLRIRNSTSLSRTRRYTDGAEPRGSQGLVGQPGAAIGATGSWSCRTRSMCPMMGSKHSVGARCAWSDAVGRVGQVRPGGWPRVGRSPDPWQSPVPGPPRPCDTRFDPQTRGTTYLVQARVGIHQDPDLDACPAGLLPFIHQSWPRSRRRVPQALPNRIRYEGHCIR